LPRENDLEIFSVEISGSPNIGVYSKATDNYLIVPSKIATKDFLKISNVLDTIVVNSFIGDSILIGVLVAANSHGILLPHYALKNEIKHLIEETGVNVKKVESRKTAMGNLILANDYGAIIDEQLYEPTLVKTIGDILDVEVVAGTIMNLPYVGSLAIATNKGVLAHPMIIDEEKALIEDVLRVPVERGTINGGVPYVSSGMIANIKGVVVGNVTTGPELFIISNLFGQ
jgi:translation initiation factor 6